MALLTWFALLVWLLSICFVANARVSPKLRRSKKLAVFCAFYAALYTGLSPFVFQNPELLLSFGSAARLIGSLFLSAYLLALVAFFYVLVFTAKNLIMAERQSDVSFFDYSGPFFLMWFFPIGVWFVQPRVNQLVANRS